ncbi:hypothetical protein BA177_04070 [Woeseia oceani]|uniref:Uncharacterized protein n=1 Tax=Woeseia oceani TaxID=1548547 RepID=A0A193LDB1_9GAMM|nr:hypothetical protein BA177_04070 [Woeseia oceani]
MPERGTPPSGSRFRPKEPAVSSPGRHLANTQSTAVEVVFATNFAGFCGDYWRDTAQELAREPALVTAVQAADCDGSPPASV